MADVAGARVERISANDAQQLATDVGPVPMNVGAVLFLDADGPPTTQALQRELESRLLAVPRLTQRLAKPPFGGGRPVWVDDPRFDIATHVRRAPCPSPGDEAAVIDMAVDAVTAPLDRSRPLWRAVLVTHLADGGHALVLAFHHVLADGIGGLSVLASLVDSPTGPAPHERLHRPRPAPSRRDLRSDAARQRLRALRGIPAGWATARAALAELGQGAGPKAPRVSLNRPTGPKRAATVVRARLDAVRRTAHHHRATVNDVLLTAATGALGELLAARGEQVAELVVSVPVAAPSESAGLGNRAGVMPVRVPTGGSVSDRLRATAAATKRQKSGRRGASAAVLTPLFRVLGVLGVFGWFVNRQRRVNSFLTNVRGPALPLSLAGARITRMFPITIAAGNVTVAFAVFTYAGELSVTVVYDPDAVPDADLLVAALQRHVNALVT